MDPMWATALRNEHALATHVSGLTSFVSFSQSFREYLAVVGTLNCSVAATSAAYLRHYLPEIASLVPAEEAGDVRQGRTLGVHLVHRDVRVFVPD